MSKLPDWFVPASGAQEFWTAERCYITELLNDAREPLFSIAIARVEVGITTQLHRLTATAERYLIRHGRGLMEIDGVTQAVAVGDQVVVAAAAAQRITNTGQEALEFYCVCTPRFVPEVYVNLEENSS